jgi:hypothetical protein
VGVSVGTGMAGSSAPGVGRSGTRAVSMAGSRPLSTMTGVTGAQVGSIRLSGAQTLTTMTSAAPKPVRSVGAGKAGNVNGTSGTSKTATGRRALPTCSGKDDLVQGLGIG